MRFEASRRRFLLLTASRGRRLVIAMLSLVAIGAAMPLAARAADTAAAIGTELNRTRSPADPFRAARGDFARRVRIRGGRKVYLECHGRGRPTVVLEAGSGNTA